MMQTVSFSVMNLYHRSTLRALIPPVLMTGALISGMFCLAAFSTSVQAAHTQQQVHYECGVFTPQTVDAVYQYSEHGPQQVILRYQGEELILPYVERNGRVLTFISDKHKWEVDYPHPALPGPLDNGRLSYRQPHQVKGWLLAIEQPLERECMAHNS